MPRQSSSQAEHSIDHRMHSSYSRREVDIDLARVQASATGRAVDVLLPRGLEPETYNTVAAGSARRRSRATEVVKGNGKVTTALADHRKKLA